MSTQCTQSCFRFQYYDGGTPPLSDTEEVHVLMVDQNLVCEVPDVVYVQLPQSRSDPITSMLCTGNITSEKLYAVEDSSGMLMSCFFS